MIFLQSTFDRQARTRTYLLALSRTRMDAVTRTRLAPSSQFVAVFFRDSWGRRHSKIVAIDAHVFRCYTDQFQAGLLKRELDKVFFAGDVKEPTHLSKRVGHVVPGVVVCPCLMGWCLT